MGTRLRVLVCEFITGGGLGPGPLPAGLAAEGDQMLSALLGDLAELDDVDVVTTRDSRLGPVEGAELQWIAPEEEPWQHWQALIRDTDACWPIAPETGGALERISRAVLAEDRVLIGSRPEAVSVAASKLRCAQHLARQGVPAVPTVSADAEPPAAALGWVVKPDDGAGCEDTWYVAGREGLHSRVACGSDRSRVVQPWVEGIAASVSMLCREGLAQVLACNAQRVGRRHGALEAKGVQVGTLEIQRRRLEPVAAGVARALPGLWGYVGVDLLLAEEGVFVVDVNPRLTTAYAGLRDVLGRNPAALVLNMLRTGALPAQSAAPLTMHAD